MKKRDRTSIQGLDPGTADWANNAVTNRAARSNKQAADAKRTRIKLDVGTLIKDILANVAEDLGTSTSQAGAYLLAEALIRYLEDDPEIPRTPSRSPRILWNVDRTDVEKRLAESAESQQCTASID